MTQAELDKQKRQIAVRIEKLRLIERARKVALLGTGKSTTYDYYVNEKFTLTHGKLLIQLNDGWSYCGGGSVRVSWDNELVLDAHRASKAEAGEIPIRETHSKSTDWAVSVFFDGEWIEALRKLAKNGLPKVKTKVTAPEAPVEAVEALSENFSPVPKPAPKAPTKPYDPFQL